MSQHSFTAVMHFAGLKAVGESVEQPLRYYRVNLMASMNLLEVSVPTLWDNLSPRGTALSISTTVLICMLFELIYIGVC